MKIRKATTEDYTGVLALYGAFASNVRLGQPPGEFRHWQAVLDHPGTTVFIADHDNEIVGMVTLHILPNMTQGGRPYALIENVITAPNQRRRGIGRKVVEKAVETARSADACRIMLLTGKHRADGGVRGFYEKLGFSADKKFGMTMS